MLSRSPKVVPNLDEKSGWTCFKALHLTFVTNDYEKKQFNMMDQICFGLLKNCLRLFLKKRFFSTKYKITVIIVY